MTSLLEEKPQVIDSPEVLEKYGDFFDPHKENWEPIKGDIEFENVSFQYPDGKEEVLSNFNSENSGWYQCGNRLRDWCRKSIGEPGLPFL